MRVVIIFLSTVHQKAEDKCISQTAELIFENICLSVCLCVSENHLCVAAAVAVLRRRGTASAKSQCLRVSGFLAQVWCFHGNGRCSPARQYQLLFLEEDAQVRTQSLTSPPSFHWYLTPVSYINRGSSWHNVTSLCRLQYKYSKLMSTSGSKECELPTADSCAIMEGEDAEDDLMDLTKKSFFTKIKSFSREVSNPFLPP